MYSGAVMILLEIFDKFRDVKLWRVTDEYYNATSNLSDGTILTVKFMGEAVVDGEWEILFTRSGSNMRGNPYVKSGQGLEVEVFSTVFAAIGKFVQEVNPETMFFVAEKENIDDSRVNLYKRMVNTFGPKLGFSVSTSPMGDGLAFILRRGS